MLLKDKVVVVSGVGPGLGKEVASAALRDGACVVVGARTESRLQKIAAELDPSGQRVAYCCTDITDPGKCDALMQVAVTRFGGLDAAVQVAAFEPLSSTLANVSTEEWHTAFDTNVLGPVQIARAAAPHLRARGGGAIVFIGTQAMWKPQLPQMSYASSKGALLSAMYYMSKELGPDKIRVNMVIPTWMWGPPVQMFVKYEAQQRGVAPEEIVRGITTNMPLGEIPPDESVADAVVFFCSDRARMITGQSLLVNAGELMR
ncbi:MAG: putative short-chain dehydrogenase/reductase [Deltaproteobacteria bacterium]|nr:putative short-chain dehydrogenase/reductase [Deltaproteobacteria bacterium]